MVQTLLFLNEAQALEPPRLLIVPNVAGLIHGDSFWRSTCANSARFAPRQRGCEFHDPIGVLINNSDAHRITNKPDLKIFSEKMSLKRLGDLWVRLSSFLIRFSSVNVSISFSSVFQTLFEYLEQI
jgi:hypothetical protein